MNDLISRKALMHKLFFAEDGRKYPTRDIDNFPVTVSLENLQKIIRDEPTAYDVDKVVEWLENTRQQVLYMADDSDYFLGQLTLLNRVISLVKGAVKDESNTMQR